jgi:hypothetical protein
MESHFRSVKRTGIAELQHGMKRSSYNEKLLYVHPYTYQPQILRNVRVKDFMHQLSEANPGHTNPFLGNVQGQTTTLLSSQQRTASLLSKLTNDLPCNNLFSTFALEAVLNSISHVP